MLERERCMMYKREATEVEDPEALCWTGGCGMCKQEAVEVEDLKGLCWKRTAGYTSRKLQK